MHRIIALGKCFADPTAVRILRCLLRHPMTIQDLQNVLLMDRHTVDLRLTKLRDAFVVHADYHGRWLKFRVSDKARPIVERLLGDFYEDVDWDPQTGADDKRVKDYISKGMLAFLPTAMFTSFFDVFALGLAF